METGQAGVGVGEGVVVAVGRGVRVGVGVKLGVVSSLQATNEAPAPQSRVIRIR